MARLAGEIAPDKIHLNTAVRPPAEKTVEAATPENMARWAELFLPRAEVIAEFKGKTGRPVLGEASVLGLLRRHASTLSQIAAALGADGATTEALLEAMRENGAVKTETRGGMLYYMEGVNE